MSAVSNPQTDDLIGGQTFGAWIVAKVDPSGKRALVVCACGTAREVGAAALLNGDSLGCGCRSTPAIKPSARTLGFAAELAAQTARSAVQWHKGRS
jgi:hypothetical protein